VGFPHLAGQLDELGDYLGGLDRSVLVQLDRLLRAETGTQLESMEQKNQ
jgi:hypothetical protein